MPADLPARLAEISRSKRLRADGRDGRSAHHHGKGALMGSSGSSNQTPVVTSQTKDPWVGAQPALNTALQSATSYFNSGLGYLPYTGQTTADLYNPANLAGINNTYSLAASEPQGSANLQAARGYLGNMVSNQGLSDPLKTMATTLSQQQNPYLQGVLDQQMAKVNSAYSGAGRYGSGMHDAAIAQAIAPTLAQDYMQRQGMAADIYNQGLQRAGQATQLIPTLDAARYASTDQLLNYGGIQRGYEQALLDQQLKLFNAQQSRPWEQLARENAIIGGAGGLGGTQITTSPGATQPSTTQKLLGGALAGAGLGSAIFPGI